jgi:putative peptide zinc metalloprotease protein
MKPAGDASTRDPRQLYITLRKDLHVSIQYYRGKPCYMLEDPQEIQFYRVGIGEGTFISMLDGKTTLDDILRETTISLGKDAFSEQEAMQIVHWLLDAKLAYPSGEISLADRKNEATHSRRHSFNPLAIRIPLAHPDRFFTAALPWCAWLFESAAWGVWICACLAAIWELLSGWNTFTKELSSVVAPHNWPSLMFAWVFLKVLHEGAHGIVCKKYGGVVSETGLMILWGMPVPYVDVTSSWAFRSKRQRIFTALAGIYVELFVAAMATLIWYHTGPGWIHYWCMHLVVIAGVTSLLFNGNPLMRFDGYYVLMDLLEIPNLYGFGQQYWQSVRGRILADNPVVLPGDTPWQRQIIACYGLLAAVWRCVVYLSLTIITLAILPFDESHMIWAIITIILATAIWRYSKKYRSPSPGEKSTPTRQVFATCAVILMLGLILIFFSTPFCLVAPAIVEYNPLHVIRNYSPGFVRKIEVRSGQSVEQGQVIAVLENDELDFELKDLQQEIAMSRLTLRTFQRKEDIGALKAEQQKLENLEQKLVEKQTQISRLVVHAPAAGIIISRQPESFLGKYFREGSEIVSLGNENYKELRVAVDQDYADDFFAQVGKPVWIRMGGKIFKSSLSLIEPRASLDPLHPALTSTKGGPLPVQRKPKESDKKDTQESEDYVLLTPQFTGEVELSPEKSDLLAAGQRVQVSFTPEGQSIGDYIFTRFQRWCRDKVRRMRSTWNP